MPKRFEENLWKIYGEGLVFLNECYRSDEESVTGSLVSFHSMDVSRITMEAGGSIPQFLAALFHHLPTDKGKTYPGGLKVLYSDIRKRCDQWGDEVVGLLEARRNPKLHIRNAATSSYWETLDDLPQENLLIEVANRLASVRFLYRQIFRTPLDKQALEKGFYHLGLDAENALPCLQKLTDSFKVMIEDDPRILPLIAEFEDKVAFVQNGWRNPPYLKKKYREKFCPLPHQPRFEPDFWKQLSARLAFASQCYGSQKRKSTGALFMTHAIGVSQRVSELGGTPQECLDALLHDVVEDRSKYHGGKKAFSRKIAKMFGRRTIETILGCTMEKFPESWCKTKQNTIYQIGLSRNPAVWMIEAADKLDNIESIRQQTYAYHNHPDAIEKVFGIFKAKLPEGVVSYFQVASNVFKLFINENRDLRLLPAALELQHEARQLKKWLEHQRGEMRKSPCWKDIINLPPDEQMAALEKKFGNRDFF